MATPQDVITTARFLLNDTSATDPRQSSTELLGYFNDGVLEISGMRADLFQSIGDYTCMPGQVDQVLSFAGAQGVVKVLAIHGGAALTPFDISTMDSFNPSWRADTAGAAEQWARFDGDPLRFYIYPKAPATLQLLDILYVRNPVTLALGDTITEIPAAMVTALEDYVVFKASMKDDEHSNSGRSTAAYALFSSKVKGA